MAKAKKMLSAVLAALMVVLSVASYVPAQAAKAVNVPKLQMVTQPEKEYKNGDRVSLTVTSPNYGGQVEYRVILWNGTTKKQSELWPTHKGYYYQNWKPAGSYKFTIHWPVEGMEPGAYSLTVLTRRANSKVAYDSFVKTEAFWVKNETVTIAPIADITVNEGEKVTLPETVTLKMSDDTTKEAKVTWDAVDTAKPGEYTVNGTVEGIETKATVKVIVKAADLAVDSVSAISNTKIQVKLSEPVSGVNASNFKVAEKAAEKALEIKTAEVESAQVVVVETAAMTAGKVYTVTVNGVSKNFTAIAAEKTAPGLSEVKCVDTNTVEVTFDKMVDKKSAETIANYTINNNVKVIKAELDSSRKVVTLTTEGVAIYKLYNLKVENVMNADGVVLKSANKNFVGSTDTKAPKITEVKVLTVNRIQVKFSDTHGIDKASAENKANYSIKAGSDELAIESVVAKYDDNEEYYDKVEIVTSKQSVGKLYTVTIDNLADGSVAANKSVKPLTTTFRGRSEDKSSPTVTGKVEVKSQTMLEIQFNDGSALDVASATDISNYEVSGDIELVSAKIKDDSDLYSADGKTVVLTTTAQTKDKSYTLTVKGVTDEFGNALKPMSGTTYRKYSFRGEGPDINPPFVSSVVSTAKLVTVVFDKTVEKASAKEIANYEIYDAAGDFVCSPTKVSVDDKTVKLTVAELSVGQKYTVKMNGIKDISGNALSNVEAAFIVKSTTVDLYAPEISYVEALYSNEVRVHFSEPVNITDVTKIAFKTTIDGKDGITLTGCGPKLLDGKTTLVMNPSVSDGKTYTITGYAKLPDGKDSAPVLDLNNNKLSFDNGSDFSNTTATYERPEVLNDWEQLDVKTIRVYFSQPVYVFTDEGKTNIDGCIATAVASDATAIDITKASKFTVTGNDTKDTLKFNFSSFVKNYAGVIAADTDEDINDISKISNTTSILPYVIDEEKPYITSVVAQSEDTVVISFNEELQTAGAYKITNLSTGKTISITSTRIDENDGSKVILRTSILNSTDSYRIVPTIGSTDLAGNRLDRTDVEVDFQGTDVKANKDYIVGVKVIDGYHVKVTSTKNIELDKIKVTTGESVEVDLDKVNTKLTSDPTVATIVTLKPLYANVKYTVNIDGLEYEFDGVIEDGGIAATINDAKKVTVTFDGSNEDGYTVLVNGIQATWNKDCGYEMTGALEAGDKISVVVKTASTPVLYAIDELELTK